MKQKDMIAILFSRVYGIFFNREFFVYHILIGMKRLAFLISKIHDIRSVHILLNDSDEWLICQFVLRFLDYRHKNLTPNKVRGVSPLSNWMHGYSTLTMII